MLREACGKEVPESSPSNSGKNNATREPSLPFGQLQVLLGHISENIPLRMVKPTGCVIGLTCLQPVSVVDVNCGQLTFQKTELVAVKYVVKTSPGREYSANTIHGGS